ncbi:hypothetical protein L2E82_23038 [Cichorium intybus]|uniref:Uncharacterized protein n=1 Tax=Cichorium intybus TaxID=13427 RepID=A0ACB9DYW7_CICIN|nr:hypothetical protein L2E82_23038 [Cichorium intybus]
MNTFFTTTAANNTRNAIIQPRPLRLDSAIASVSSLTSCGSLSSLLLNPFNDILSAYRLKLMILDDVGSGWQQ